MAKRIILICFITTLIVAIFFIVKRNFFDSPFQASTGGEFFADFTSNKTEYDFNESIKFSAKVQGLNQNETAELSFWSDCQNDSADLATVKIACGTPDKEFSFEQNGSRTIDFNYQYDLAAKYFPKAIFSTGDLGIEKNLGIKLNPVVKLIAGNYFNDSIEVPYGSSFDISWEAQGLISSNKCNSSWGGVKNLAGSEKVYNATKPDDTLSIECGEGDSKGSDKLEVKIIPSITLRARNEDSGSFNTIGNEIKVPMDSKVVLSWNALGVLDEGSACIGSQGDETWATIKRPSSGSYTSSELTSSKEFSLVCQGSGGLATATYSVQVESGNCILKGGNEIEALTFCRNNLRVADLADNIGLKGSFVAQNIFLPGSSANIRFFYNYPVEKNLPPGFRYLSPPDLTETKK